jgi:hypothetical protein
MPRRLATTYAKLHHDVPPPEPSPPTSESSGYLDALEDDETDVSMSSEKEEKESPPPYGLLEAALLGSFKTAQRESSMMVVRAITSATYLYMRALPCTRQGAARPPSAT